jgi:hypothetical protein
MARPLTDIAKINNSLPIKNGSITITATSAGQYATLNTNTVNTPAISNIQAKYGYRFYNGILVNTISNEST